MSKYWFKGFSAWVNWKWNIQAWTSKKYDKSTKDLKEVSSWYSRSFSLNWEF